MFIADACKSLVLLGTCVNSNLRPLGLNGYFSSRFIVMSAQLNLFSVTAGGYKFLVNVLLDLFFVFREVTLVN